MARTFGGATGDDISLTLTNNLASGRHMLVCGWFYPTTLTATRALWSIGTSVGAEIDTTTSELRLTTLHATTNGVWTTTGAGLTVNTWSFVATLVSVNSTGPADDWRVWTGRIDVAPVESTIASVTAPVGSVTAVNTFTIGNRGTTGTVAFQGDIESVVVGLQIATIDVTQNALPIATAGTITQTEADLIYQRLVQPIWAGDLTPTWAFGGQFAGAAATGRSGLEIYSFPLDGALAATIKRYLPATAADVNVAPSVSGTISSQNRGPRVYQRPALNFFGRR
jgi:hypothetical protein